MTSVRADHASQPPDGDAAAQSAPRPGLFERLRNAFGLHASSIREDIEEALDDEKQVDGDFSPQERAILRNVLALHEHRVRDIMIPRADIVAIGIESPLTEVLSLFRTAGHSRLPVHGETLDDPRGMVHIRDLVDFLARRAERLEDARRGEHGALTGSRDLTMSASEDTADRRRRIPRFVSESFIDLSAPLSQTGIVRPVLFIPPSMPALDLLVRMQATRTHMALVIDEYGGTDGLVSIEDVVEMIVGDIEDEHDAAERPLIVRSNDEDYSVDGRAGLTDLANCTGWSLPSEFESLDVDTIGGLVTMLAGHVPTRGEVIRDPSGIFEFEILDADPRRVKMLKMSQKTPILASPDDAREPPTSTSKAMRTEQ